MSLDTNLVKICKWRVPDDDPVGPKHVATLRIIN